MPSDEYPYLYQLSLPDRLRLAAYIAAERGVSAIHLRVCMSCMTARTALLHVLHVLISVYYPYFPHYYMYSISHKEKMTMNDRGRTRMQACSTCRRAVSSGSRTTSVRASVTGSFLVAGVSVQPPDSVTLFSVNIPSHRFKESRAARRDITIQVWVRYTLESRVLIS